MQEDFQSVKSLINSFGEQLGISHLELDSENCFRLSIDDQTTIDCQYQSGFLYMIHALPDLENHSLTEQFLTAMLEASLFDENFAGLTFGLDQELGELVLFVAIPTKHVGPELLQEFLDRLVSGGEYWKKWITPSGKSGESIASGLQV